MGRMKNEDFINSMKELIRCYEICNDPNSPVSREIQMWRFRFLKDNNKIKSCDSLTENYFMATSSDVMMEKTPERCLSIYIKLQDKH